MSDFSAALTSVMEARVKATLPETQAAGNYMNTFVEDAQLEVLDKKIALIKRIAADIKQLRAEPNVDVATLDSLERISARLSK